MIQLRFLVASLMQYRDGDESAQHSLAASTQPTPGHCRATMGSGGARGGTGRGRSGTSSGCGTINARSLKSCVSQVGRMTLMVSVKVVERVPMEELTVPLAVSVCWPRLSPVSSTQYPSSPVV